MRLKLFRNDDLVSDTTKQKKSRICLQLERVFHDKSYIRVDYPCGWNDSDHLTDDSLKRALSSYTEKSLIDFLCSNGETK